MTLHRYRQIRYLEHRRLRLLAHGIAAIEWLGLLLLLLSGAVVHAENRLKQATTGSQAGTAAPPAPPSAQTPVLGKAPGSADRKMAGQARSIVIRQPHRITRRMATKRFRRRGGHQPPRVQRDTQNLDSPVLAANAAARLEPTLADYVNAIQHYPYSDGALFQIYTSPGQITDLALQEGEQLVGTGAVAAGDTVRWIIGDTESGSGPARRIHILVKPTRADLATNLIINTDRRTYHLELRATPATSMTAVNWTYPEDQLIALKARKAEEQRAAPVSAGLDLASLDFRYRIEGDKAPWRPVRAFDNGRQVMIEFAQGIATGDMPPLFVVGSDGSAELVNYRVQGRYMVVDRLFAAAELRLGTTKHQQIVRILRDAAAKGKRT